MDRSKAKERVLGGSLLAFLVALQALIAAYVYKKVL